MIDCTLDVINQSRWEQFLAQSPDGWLTLEASPKRGEDVSVSGEFWFTGRLKSKGPFGLTPLSQDRQVSFMSFMVSTICNHIFIIICIM